MVRTCYKSYGRLRVKFKTNYNKGLSVFLVFKTHSILASRTLILWGTKLFPTSLCGVLVFRLAPAAPLPLPLPRPPAAASLTHLIHHSTTHHTSLITALLITPLVNHTTPSHHSTTHHTTCQSHHAVVWQAQYTECGRRITQSLEELLRAWSPADPRRAFVWQAQCTGPAGGTAAVVVAAWPAAGVRVADELSWERCSTQSLLEELWAGSHTIFDSQLCHTPLCHTPSFTHTTLSHAIFHTSSFTPAFSHTIFHTHNFVTPSLSHTTLTHYLSHTTLSHTIFDTALCHAPSFTQHLSHTFFVTPLCHTPSFTHHLWHTIFYTPFFTHTTLPHTIFHTPLCQTPSFTHHLWHHIFVTHHLWHTVTGHLSHTTLSHTIFDTPCFPHNFVTHHLSPHHLCHTPSFTTPPFTHTQLCHTPSFLHLLFCLSFLPRPRYNISCSLLEEVDLWGYPLL